MGRTTLHCTAHRCRTGPGRSGKRSWLTSRTEVSAVWWRSSRCRRCQTEGRQRNYSLWVTINKHQNIGKDTVFDTTNTTVQEGTQSVCITINTTQEGTQSVWITINRHAPYVCGFAWSDMVHGCMEYTERAEMAAVSCGTSHASGLSTPLRWIFKTKTKKRVIRSYSLM